jgi:hypothetical protein
MKAGVARNYCVLMPARLLGSTGGCIPKSLHSGFYGLVVITDSGCADSLERLRRIASVARTSGTPVATIEVGGGIRSGRYA